MNQHRFADSFKFENVCDWGKTLVVAPHPDDESLGCGGAIALLRKFGHEVYVLTMTDGVLSHPNSKKFPASSLRDLREQETLTALNILNVSAAHVTFLRLPDRHVPAKNEAGFSILIKNISSIITKIQPSTVLVPWRRDPHPDHRATWEIFKTANIFSNEKYRLLEYPIWLWEMAEAADLPEENEVTLWHLDIAQVLGQKHQAIYSHASQITNLIDDDPEGFRLSAEVLAQFNHPTEIYLEGLQ